VLFKYKNIDVSVYNPIHYKLFLKYKIDILVFN